MDTNVNALDLPGQAQPQQDPAAAEQPGAAETQLAEIPAPGPLADENVTLVDYNDKKIYLVGTAHVSPQSAELVGRVIEKLRPDSVCIELDPKRFENLKNPEAWKNTDVVQVIKEKRVGFLLANLALSAYQKRMAKKLGSQVGGEMLQGITSAEEVGAELVLADRDIQTTFMRIWRKLGGREKIKLIYSLVFGLDEEEGELDETSLQELMQSDMLESMLKEVKEEFPQIGQVLITERDQFLANKIKNAPGEIVVAVLGAAHVPGIKEEIFKDQDMVEIDTVPPKGKTSKVVGWIIPLLIIGLIVYGFFQNAETGWQQVTSWWLWNGGLSALGTLLVLGHPLSILTAFVAAPITSLNPFLAAGWFAGLVQAYVKKPTVEDVQNVQEDITSLRGFFRNRMLKVLAVVIMANIGSVFGTFLGGAEVIRNLF